MKFELEAPRSTIAVQESVPLRFRLHNDESDIEIPFDYESTDVLTLILADDAGQVVCRADGYERMKRHGVWEPRIAQAELETGTLPSGAILVWESDLLLYLEVPEPGRYSLVAEFRFLPSGIEVRSHPVKLEVKPNHPSWIDVIEDYVSIGMTYSLQQTDSGEGPRGLLRLASSLRPEVFWKGGVLPLPIDAEPRISEADFGIHETFEHDLFRWIIWMTADNLSACRFKENAPIDPVYEYALGNDEWQLAGRPVQDIHFGVSVPTLNRSRDGFRLRWLDFSDKFEPVKSIEVASVAVRPYPVVSAADRAGTRYLVYAEAGKLPIRLIELGGAGQVQRVVTLSATDLAGAQQEIDLENILQTVALRVWVKGGPVESRALYAALTSDGEQGMRALLCRVPLAPGLEPGEAIQIDTIELPREILDSGEFFVGGAIAETMHSGLHAVLTTSRGRLFHVAKNIAPQVIDGTDDTEIIAPGPFLIISRDIHLFFAHRHSHGIVDMVIYQALRR